LAFVRRAAKNLPGRSKLIGIISIVVIVAASYGLFFYFQTITESSIRNNLFDQQQQRQLDSTKALSEHIGSDLDSIMSKLQGLANSLYLQQGDLSSNQTKNMLKQVYSSMTTANIVDRLFVLNRSDVSVVSLAANGQQLLTGVNFSYRDWVERTKATLTPVFSNGFQGMDGKYRIALTYPIINMNSKEYLGLVAAQTPTIQFFQHYGNIHNITSQYLAVLDSRSVQLIHPVKAFVGTPFFGRYTQQITEHNTVLNSLIRQVMSGQPGFAVYDFINGQRLNTGYPIFIQGKPTYFVFVITPTANIYSQINSIIFTERIEMLSLLSGITAAIVVLVLFLVKWSSTLQSEVKRRTKELNELNEQLGTANEQLKVHDKMQQEFINVAAHELRTPIQPIIGLVEMLRSKQDLQESERHQILDVLSRNAKRLQRLANDVLDVTRIESHTLKLNKEKINLISSIQDTVEQYRENLGNRSSINMKFSYEKSHPKQDGQEERSIIVNIDKNRIIQVISNLLDNAIKFTKQEEGGRTDILITVEQTSNNKNGKMNGQVIVNISDNGVGIDPKLLPKLFSKFVSKSFQGTGLGLFICKSIIEAHGGKIWAKNNANGKGATFSFSLPILTGTA
jgi:signal transduction histidine kinase